MEKLNISHILVAQGFEADDVLRKLKEGVSFEDLAAKFSTCPSGKSGGSLGDIELRRLDSTFAEAARKLSVGALSGPVKTRFGYHIIRRNA